MRRLLDYNFISDKEILIHGGVEEVLKRMA
jgi:hypothetical protein